MLPINIIIAPNIPRTKPKFYTILSQTTKDSYVFPKDTLPIEMKESALNPYPNRAFDSKLSKK